MKILPAESSDIPALYRLQLLAFESEAEMIGSRAVPALQETEEEHRADFLQLAHPEAGNRYRQNDRRDPL